MPILVTLIYSIYLPQVIFEPRIVDFDSKLSDMHRQNLDVTDEISDVFPTDRFVSHLPLRSGRNHERRFPFLCP